MQVSSSLGFNPLPIEDPIEILKYCDRSRRASRRQLVRDVTSPGLFAGDEDSAPSHWP